MEIKLTTIGSSPVFEVSDTAPYWSRVFGATEDQNNSRWLFPAFPPFMNNVLEDLKKVHKGIVLSPEVQDWVSSKGTIDAALTHVHGLTLPVKSFDHQLDGLAEVMHNYRWILNWEMGTGKSKIIVDAVQQLQCKTLILCPLIAVDNWIEQMDFHSGGTVKSIALKGAATTKKNAIKRAIKNDVDVIVTTYDSARTLGFPHIDAKVDNYCKRNMVVLHAGLLKPLKQLNNPKLQLELVQKWNDGEVRPKEIREIVAEEIKDKPQWLVDYPYTMIVADESHRIKRQRSQRTKACLHLSKQAGRRVLLTGTLTHGDPWDLYPQLRFLAPYLNPENVKQFKEMFIQVSPWNDRIVTGYKNLHILNNRVSQVSSVRKLKDCVTLPSRSFYLVKFDLTAAQKRDYNNVVQDWVIERPDCDDLEIENGAIRVSKLLQLCSGFVYVPENLDICDKCHHLRNCVNVGILPGSKKCVMKDQIPESTRILRYPDNPKMDALKDILVDVLNVGKVIIWAVMTEELDSIEKMLKGQNIGYVRVDGSTTKHVQSLANRFNSDPDCEVYLAQISTGIAITLNAAKYTVYYSRDWSVDHRQQSLARNYRIGQNEKTVVYDLCARNTVEANQLDALAAKDRVASLLTDRVNCSICREYKKCLEKDVIPWSEGCVLASRVAVDIAKARKI